MSEPDDGAPETGSIFSAPGKAFLLGEYAVLEGAPAVVAAVSCRARGQFVRGARPASRLIEEAARVMGGDWESAEPGAVVVDTRAFADSHGRKLGTGSSAAVAAVAVAALRERASRNQARNLAASTNTSTTSWAPSEDERRELFVLADSAHRASQGGVGSGGDVAAAIYGGLIRFTPSTEAHPAIDRLRWPVGVEALWFSAPVSASTPAFVAEVKAYAGRSPQRYREHLRVLVEHAAAGTAALAAQNVGELLAHVAAYGAAMGTLGAEAGVPIVIPAFAAAARLATEVGGAAKPSGAGGGDIGVALFPNAARRQAFADRLPELGLAPLALRLDLVGTASEARAPHERTNV